MTEERIWTDNFINDLIHGAIAEKVFIEYLKENGFENIAKNDDAEFDISGERNGKTIKFEVKFQQPGYNSMIVEYSYNKKPSGICLTLADYYVLVRETEIGVDKEEFVLYELFIIKTEVLKMIIIHNIELKRQFMSGQRVPSDIVFVPLTNDFHSTRIKLKRGFEND